MQNVHQTIISQYATSPTINQLIESMNEYIDPRTNMQMFYDFVWNIDTAQGFGLDIWGKIIDVGRTFKVVRRYQSLGFDEGHDYQPFGQAPFFDSSYIETVTLDDSTYKTLIMVKALANISATNAKTLNILLRQLFDNRRCYVSDMGEMRMNYVFEFILTEIEYAILTQSNVMPKPAGVEVNIIQLASDQLFGFVESGSAQPFGQGPFYPA